MRHGKIIFIFALLLSGLAACGRPANSAAPPMAKSGPTDAEIAVSLDGDTQVVQVTADDTMHFNGNRFTVHTGKPVRVELQNIGHTPRDQMAHNFVILQPGTDAASYNLAAAQAKSAGYVPPDQMGLVVAFAPLAGPGQTVTAEFTAPAPGDYPFLCNFPGHFAAGMHGMMTVAP